MPKPHSDCIKHITHYGRATQGRQVLHRMPLPADFTFNSPVGVEMDRLGQVWVCDTGNNRLVLLNADLNEIIAIFKMPSGDGSSGSKGINSAATTPFRMPFHLASHPERNRMFITDMGNSRVVAMDYEEGGASFAFAFGMGAEGKSTAYEPLQDPNGIVIVKVPKGGYNVFVNDEFFHTAKEPKRNRCVRFDENGGYISEFRTLIDPDGSRHDLYWPQGLAVDHKNNLYIANTGSYEVLRCHAFTPVDKQYCLRAETPTVHHKLLPTKGMGVMNIMRDVSVVGEHVFVPDHTANTISVYDLDSRHVSTLVGVRPMWNHGAEPKHSITDGMYYSLEDHALVSPYVITAGETPETFYLSEPFCSRIAKLRIDDLTKPISSAQLIAAAGERRNAPKHSALGQTQFNCVTAAVSVPADTRRDASAANATPELPSWVTLNPWQQGWMQASAAMTRQYDAFAGKWINKIHTIAGGEARHQKRILNLDAGNWTFQAYEQSAAGYEPDKSPLRGYFVAGNLSMTWYQPRVPLLGQLCPGTPILLVVNFNLGTVTMYQVGLLGGLYNYGVPFGFFGQGDGFLRGPEGIVASTDGEVFIADTLNNRIAKWQVLQTGQVVFVRNFVWDKDPPPKPIFTPTDVAVDAAGRVFVTDQFNNRICVFDRNGQSLWAVGHEGYWEEGQPDGARFMLPTSLAIDGETLILNDLVNRALKLFRITAKGLDFIGGISLFKRDVDHGGVWMPFFMHAAEGRVYVADSTYNIVQVYEYETQ
jgi:DNA-binding beta-propeller fold protein YncE